MIKKTLYFGNPAYLSRKQAQIQISFPKEVDRAPVTRPIEDVGIVILDHPQITISQALLSSLLENNVAILSCDEKHLPLSLMLPMHSHSTYAENLRVQLDASEPLKKSLWQQTVKEKIRNQAALLVKAGFNVDNMKYWADKVRSGDPDNYEGRAAAFYWKNIVDDGFKRGRFEDAPNNLLNYGYAVLRACVARALVSSGMHCAMGIHHRNKYNPYCLADDIMEPYRPLVDQLVLNTIGEFDENDLEQLSPKVKRALLVIPTIDVEIEGNKSPLMVGVSRTTASLMECYRGERRKILYPKI